MSQETSLNGEWELRDEPMHYGLAEALELTHKSDGWIKTPVPGDIHQGLVNAGRIKEPLLALNSFECRWTENRSWWLRKTFTYQSEWVDSEILKLELNGLDSNAEIFLNGHHIGSHQNAFYPFSKDILPWLQKGPNILLVRLTTGLETISVADIAPAADPRFMNMPDDSLDSRPERDDPRRTFVRKPQYAVGWDWNPRVVTIAIAGDVKIRAMREACIREVRLKPVQENGDISIAATVTIDKFHYYQTTTGSISVNLTDETGQVYQTEKDVFLRSGNNYVKMTIPIENPNLWWPNGLGEQHLYQVQAELKIGDYSTVHPPFEYGLRFIDLDTREKFAFIINGVKVFCKGANWVPADTLYARVTAEKYETLIYEAHQANFNMLRVWGGGLYEPDAFYQACDRHGILIWQDFMFACAPYPDHLESFKQEVEREADYQTRRLRNHACVALFCGNNENHWGFRDWWNEETKAGAEIYNYLLPRIVHHNCAEIPYWNSSPYGGDAPNCYEIGDSHPWAATAMNPEMEKRINPECYDQIDALFISEYGYPGAPDKASVLEYMDGAPLNRKSRTWQHHNNVFEKQTVDAGIRKHYLGEKEPTLDQYFLYSGLCQGMMLEYSIDSARRRSNCQGNLIWMYNDSWGEVGWTLIDYYLRRKPSWYFVRRANAPVRLILRPVRDEISVAVSNNTQQKVNLELEVGYISLDGSFKEFETFAVNAMPLANTQVDVIGRGNHDPRRGLWVARSPGKSDLSPAIFRAVDYRELQVVSPGLKSNLVKSEGQVYTLRISTQSYAHAVNLALPEGAIPSDNYFDLLPAESRDIQIAFPALLSPEMIRVSCVNGT